MPDLTIKKDGVLYVRHSALFEKEIKPLILVPFNNGIVPVYLQRLNYAQIRACGSFSLIETIDDVIAKKRKLKPSEMLEYVRKQYSVVEKSMLSPSLKDIIDLNNDGERIAELEKALEELQEKIEEMNQGSKKYKLEQKADLAEMQLKFSLPANFITHIVAYALSLDNSDIKDVSEDMLYESACLARAGNDNPHEHLPGNFTDFNRVDIDNRAWAIYYRRTKDVSNNPKRRI